MPATTNAHSTAGSTPMIAVFNPSLLALPASPEALRERTRRRDRAIGKLTAAVWEWLKGDWLGCYLEDAHSGGRIDPLSLSVWCEGALGEEVRADADADAAAAVLSAACPLCDWCWVAWRADLEVERLGLV